MENISRERFAGCGGRGEIESKHIRRCGGETVKERKLRLNETGWADRESQCSQTAAWKWSRKYRISSRSSRESTFRRKCDTLKSIVCRILTISRLMMQFSLIDSVFHTLCYWWGYLDYCVLKLHISDEIVSVKRNDEIEFVRLSRYFVSTRFQLVLYAASYRLNRYSV